MKTENNTPAYWRGFYKAQEFLGREFIDNYIGTVTGGIRIQSGLPEALNQDAHKVAEIIYKRSDLKPTIKKSRISVVNVSDEAYHVHLDNLDAGLRDMVHPHVKAENYYIAVTANGVVGGFTTQADGYLQGLFSLESGRGEELLRLQLSQMVKDFNRVDVNTYCFESPMVDILLRSGFKSVKVDNWDERLAPKQWDSARFGTPKVIHLSREVL